MLSFNSKAIKFLINQLNFITLLVIQLFITLIKKQQMQLSQICLKNNQNVFSAQNIRKLACYGSQQSSPRKIQKMPNVKGRVSSSISARLEKGKSVQNSIKITLSPLPYKNESIPSKVYQYQEMVTKKGCLLRLKHNINNCKSPFPNIVDIKQSVKENQQSFARCMNRELDSTGNANLLNHLRRDVPFEKHNYLKEACRYVKRERNYLLHAKDESKDYHIVLPPLVDTCQSSQH